VRRRVRARGDTTRPPVPPGRIDLGRLVLRRLRPDDAAAVSAAAGESLDHLRPWMAWATPEGTSVEVQRRRLLGAAGTWTPAGGYEYGVFLLDGRLVGACGLHRRVGPAALEIGYWVHVAHTRQGVATAAAGALTAAGFGVRGIERMEIRCDEANVASAAVPPKLGYRLAGRIDHEPEAPGEVGTRLVWVLHRREWTARRP